MPPIFQSILIVGITCYLLSTLLFVLTRNMLLNHGGVAWWALASIAGATGYGSLLAYGSTGDPTSGEALYNLSLISWASFIYIGTHQWLGKPIASGRILAVGFISTVWVFYFNFIQPAFLPAAIVTALTCGILTLHSGWLFMKSLQPGDKQGWLLVSALFISGVHALDYPILRPYESLALFGILLCIFASLAINTLLASMVIIQFRNRMQDSKQQAIDIAMQDPLTGLNNRLGLTKAFERLANELDTNKYRMAVIFADLDDFKIINDTYGHEDGDEVLRIISARIRATVRDTDTVARLGGDEFVVVLSAIGTHDWEHIPKCISRLINNIKEPIAVNQHLHRVGVSIGLATYPKDGKHLQDLLNCADASMYLDKRMKKRSSAPVITSKTPEPETLISLDALEKQPI